MKGLRPLGEILLSQGKLPPEELEAALAAQASSGQSLRTILLQRKAIDEANLIQALASELGLEIVEEIPDDDLDFGLVERLPIQYLKKNQVLPRRRRDSALEVVAADPLRLEVLDDLRLLYQVEEVRAQLATSKTIISAINRTYGQAADTAEQIIQDLDQAEEGALLPEIGEQTDLLDETSEAPIIKLVNQIISQAVKAGASDIHFEPYQNHLQVRFRLDGVLHNVLRPPRRLHASIVSRVKVMARLNIAEKRLPQDGRMDVRIGDRVVDVRVSCIPTAFGERVVLRLLEKTSRLMRLEEIGIPPGALKEMKRLIHLPYGIILVTGPTGSGKTTTLYAALNHINLPDKNILTIEDPVEYQLDGIGQMQVNPKINLTFANGLRSMVRQDPDVIMVGEIRDLETAEIAIQSALTGHLVFSTLHTNDAASAVTRLIDMGIEPFLVSSAVQAIIAQRLVRLVCPRCREPYTAEAAELTELGAKEHSRATIFRARGCAFCLETGYRGRTGIFEFLILNEDLRQLLMKTPDANRIREAAIAQGMETLRDDGIRKVVEGKTTVAEVMRVTQL